jgi:hypothetical protein
MATVLPPCEQCRSGAAQIDRYCTPRVLLCGSGSSHQHVCETAGLVGGGKCVQVATVVAAGAAGARAQSSCAFDYRTWEERESLVVRSSTTTDGYKTARDATVFALGMARALYVEQHRHTSLTADIVAAHRPLCFAALAYHSIVAVRGCVWLCVAACSAHRMHTHRETGDVALARRAAALALSVLPHCGRHDPPRQANRGVGLGVGRPVGAARRRHLLSMRAVCIRGRRVDAAIPCTW